MHPRPRHWNKRCQVSRLHAVDATEDVSEVLNGIDVEPVAGGDEGQKNRSRLATLVGARKEKILATKNKVLDCALAGVVVDVERAILQEARQRNPVRECVRYGFHELVCRRVLSLQPQEKMPELFYKWFRSLSSNSQSLCRRLSVDSGLDDVELAIDIQDVVCVGIVWVVGEILVIAPARVGMAAGAFARTVFEQRLPAAGCVGLNDSFVAFEECAIFGKRQVGRKLEYDPGMIFIPDVRRHLSFAHAAHAFGILNFDLSVVGLDDGGSFDLDFGQFVDLLEQARGGQDPVALRRSGNRDLLAAEDLRLTIERKSVGEFGNDDVSKQSRSHVATGNRRRWFFGHDHVLFAFGTGPNFLSMLKLLEGLRDTFELVCDLVPHFLRLDEACRANLLCFVDVMVDVLNRQVLVEDVLLVHARSGIFGLRRLPTWWRVRVAAWLMLLSGCSEFGSCLSLVLLQQDIQLVAQILELLLQIRVALQGQRQLLRQGGDTSAQFGIFFSKEGELLVA